MEKRWAGEGTVNNKYHKKRKKGYDDSPLTMTAAAATTITTVEKSPSCLSHMRLVFKRNLSLHEVLYIYIYYIIFNLNSK